MSEKITASLQVRCSRSAHLTQPCCGFYNQGGLFSEKAKITEDGTYLQTKIIVLLGCIIMIPT